MGRIISRYFVQYRIISIVFRHGHRCFDGFLQRIGGRSRPPCDVRWTSLCRRWSECTSRPSGRPGCHTTRRRAHWSRPVQPRHHANSWSWRDARRRRHARRSASAFRQRCGRWSFRPPSTAVVGTHESTATGLPFSGCSPVASARPLRLSCHAGFIVAVQLWCVVWFRRKRHGARVWPWDHLDTRLDDPSTYRDLPPTTVDWLRITERTEYKLLSLTYKVLTTTQPPYLHNLISVQRPRSTCSSSLVTLFAWPPSSSSLKITDCFFLYASSCLWNQIPLSLCHPHFGTSSSISKSSIPSPITSSTFDSPLCSSITPSLFHSWLKTYSFHKSTPPPVSLLPPGLPSQTIARTVSSDLLIFLFLFFHFCAVR